MRLDRVREDCQCHIFFDQDLSGFKIHGDSVEAVSDAAKAIKAFLQEALVVGIPSTRIILVDLTRSTSQDRIAMVKVNDPTMPFHAASSPVEKGRIARIVERPTGTLRPEDWVDRVSKLAAQNVRVLRIALSDILANLRMHMRPVQMRCVFGVFVWQSYWWQPKEAIDQPIIPFVENSQDQRTQGSIYGLWVALHETSPENALIWV